MCRRQHTRETFPDKPARIIVAFPAGGGTDIVARLIAERLTALWHRQVVVDNRGGAGGVIGTERRRDPRRMATSS